MIASTVQNFLDHPPALRYVVLANTTRAVSRRLKPGCSPYNRNEILSTVWGCSVRLPSVLVDTRNAVGIFYFEVTV